MLGFKAGLTHRCLYGAFSLLTAVLYVLFDLICVNDYNLLLNTAKNVHHFWSISESRTLNS